MSQRNLHKWQFSPRFRRHAYGWKSQPAITRVREAVSEIRQVARRDKALAGGGAVPDELIDLLRGETLWDYRRWAAMALSARGDRADAIRLAEQSRNAWSSDLAIDRFCEETLLASGFVDEACASYGLRANRASTYKAWFRAVSKKYPHKEPAAILHDLVGTTPGDEGKWFAAAKDVGMFDEAITLANRSPCSPHTLTRAARDYREKNPAFAVEAGLAALRWLAAGYGYDITRADVYAACEYTLEAADHAGAGEETERLARAIAAMEAGGSGMIIRTLEDCLARRAATD